MGDWLPYLPKTIDLTGVSEWFRSGRVFVGVDRNMSIVVYRNSTLAAYVKSDESSAPVLGANP